MRFSEEETLEISKVLPKDCDSIEDYEAALKKADEIDVESRNHRNLKKNQKPLIRISVFDFYDLIP